MTTSKKEMTVNYAIDNLMDNGMMPCDFNQNVRITLNSLYDKMSERGYVSSGALADGYRNYAARQNKKQFKLKAVKH